MTHVALAVLGSLVLGLCAPIAVQADEAKTPIVPMILNLMAPPASAPSDSLLSEAMRAPGPKPRVAAVGGGEVQPDGSVKYGDVSVTIKNPCPEGTSHYEPPPLPGRRVRK